MLELIALVTAVFAIVGIYLLWRSRAPRRSRIKWLLVVILLPIAGTVLCAVMHDGACREPEPNKQ